MHVYRMSLYTDIMYCLTSCSTSVRADVCKYYECGVLLFGGVSQEKNASLRLKKCKDVICMLMIWIFLTFLYLSDFVRGKNATSV